MDEISKVSENSFTAGKQLYTKEIAVHGNDYWSPEENKLWPEYIKDSFKLLNATYRLDTPNILTTLNGLGSEISETSLLYYLIYRLKELHTAGEINQEKITEVCNAIKTFVETKEVNIPSSSVYQLGELGQSAQNILLHLVNSDNSDVRLSALYALKDTGQSAIPILKSYTTDQFPIKVRERAIQALGEIGKEALSALSDQAEVKDTTIRSTVIHALGNCGPSALDILALLARDPDHTIRHAVIIAAIHIGDKSLDLLRNLTNDESEYIRKEAQKGMDRIINAEKKYTLDELEKLAESDSEEDKTIAAQSAYGLGINSIGLLKKMATDNQGQEVRISAIRSLGSVAQLVKDTMRDDIGSRDAILTDLTNYLNSILKSDDAVISKVVLSSLCDIGSLALPVISSYAENDSPDIRKEIAFGLYRVGEPARNLLDRFSKDKDKGVRRAAYRSLMSLKNNLYKKNLSLKEKVIKSLIVREEPFFADILGLGDIYDPKGNEGIIDKLRQVVSNLQTNQTDSGKSHPELVGVSFQGSLMKGYWMKGVSDIDCAFIIDMKEPDYDSVKHKFMLIDQLKKEADNMGLETDMGPDIVNIADNEYYKSKGVAGIFSGLFVGDRNRLNEIKKRILSTIDKEKWRDVQYAWSSNLLYDKTEERYGLSREEITLIRNLRNFLWSLPDLTTMKSQFN